ncbi:SIR2 family NAD-dependent protein deacylase [Aggregatilinea lenta]|uniref:SIR2 family NAD-dependent protein deacylase n=1 Tax=Aggregatilinea lenta TaxID=913108 RepID=UPI000E5B6131|nr:NAD-dependent deacylase [Aggregatilinea lenta]
MNGESSFRAALDLLRQGRYVVALTGAGISTRSGIPDFRSPTSGLWERANPAEVASIYGFRHHPERFYDWIRPLAHLIFDAEPNSAHLALAHMEAAGHLASIVTQNIDMLHTRAGSHAVYEVHGHLREVTCIQCFSTYPAEPLIQDFFRTNTLPRCPICGNVLKPNVILFGEQLPAVPLMAARREARHCDVMLIVGSSLEVYPAAELPLLARESGASLILVNLADTPLDALADVVIHADVVDVLPRLASALESE